MLESAKEVAYAGWIPNVATVLWTNEGRAQSFAIISSMFLSNATGAAVNVSLRIVPSGGVITDTQYDIMPNVAIAVQQVHIFSDIGNEDLGIYMRAGDQLVGVASAATSVALRVHVKRQA